MLDILSSPKRRSHPTFTTQVNRQLASLYYVYTDVYNILYIYTKLCLYKCNKVLGVGDIKRKFDPASLPRTCGVSAMRHFLRSTRSTWFKLMKATSRTKPTAEADIMPVLLVSVALGGTFLLARRRTDMTTASRISPRDMQYLCEGSSNLLCKAKSDGYVLQFKKDVCKDRTSQMIDLERHRLMQQFLARWFAGSNVSVPEILSVPASDVRAVDAHILASRSKAVRKERLDVGSDIRVMLLRREDLLSPACVSLEVTPGCGLQELQGIPSRHCMMYSESLLNPTQMQNDPNLQVFSADMAERSAGLAASLREKSDQHCLRTEMFGADGACFGLAGSARGDVEKFLQQVGLSVEEISKLGAQSDKTCPGTSPKAAGVCGR